MKRSSITGFLIASFFVTASLSAMYQSNPSAPEIIDEGFFLNKDCFMGLKVGYQHDQVFDRNLGADSGASRVDGCDILSDQGVLTLNFFDRLEVWGSAGAASFHMIDEVNSPPTQFEYESRAQFIWGVGGRATLFCWGNTTLGVSAGYQQAHPKTSWNTLDAFPFPHNSTRLHYSEWQIGVGFSHKIDIFIPYIGGTYSRATAKLHDVPRFAFDTGTDVKMTSDQNFGLTVGCDLSTGRIVDLGVEFRMFSERAVTVRGDVKF